MRVPANAFELYTSMGVDRSYQAVADQLGVHKRSIVKMAKRQRWMDRINEIEREAQRRVDERMTEDLVEMRLRHRKLLKAMAARAARAIAELPLATAMEGVRTAEIVIKLERLMSDQPIERTEVTVADVTRREIRHLIER